MSRFLGCCFILLLVLSCVEPFQGEVGQQPVPDIGSAPEDSSAERFTIAFTDAPRWKVGNDNLIHVTVAAVYAFDDSLSSLTESRFDVDFKHSGVLGGQIETIDQVLTGTIRSTTPAIPALAGYAPNIQMLSIPYLWENPVVAWEVLDGEFGRRFFDDIAAQSGLRVISIFDNGGYRNLSNNVRPIRTPDDLSGMKIRTLESPAQMKIVESLGGAPTPIAWTELYTALQTGVVDGQENSPATTIVGSLHEVQKFYTLDRHTLSLAALVVSEEWFQSLPEEVRTQVQLAGRIASVAGRGTAWTNNKIALEYLEQRGLQIYRPTSEELSEFKQRSQATVLEWMRENPRIDNEWLDQLLESVRRVEEELQGR